MKKIIAFILAIIVIMSLGCVCFADKEYSDEFCSSIPTDSGIAPIKVKDKWNNTLWLISLKDNKSEDGYRHIALTKADMQTLAWKYDNMAGSKSRFPFYVYGKSRDYYKNCFGEIDYVGGAYDYIPMSEYYDDVYFIGFDKNGELRLYTTTIVPAEEGLGSIKGNYGSLWKSGDTANNITGEVDVIFAREAMCLRDTGEDFSYNDVVYNG